MKTIKSEKKKSGPPEFTMARIEELATELAETNRALTLLSQQKAETSKSLIEMMQFNNVKFVNVKLNVNGQTERYGVELVDRKGSIQDKVGIISTLTSRVIRKMILKKKIDYKIRHDDIERISRSIARYISKNTRVDAFLISEMKEKEWAKVFIVETETKPYLYIKDGFVSEEKVKK